MSRIPPPITQKLRQRIVDSVPNTASATPSLPLFIYVMAHGAGSDELSNPSLNFISYNDFVRTQKAPQNFTQDQTFPMIFRLAKTGQSVVSNCGSDRANVNKIMGYILNPEIEQQIQSQVKRRGASAHQGHRSWDELYSNLQGFHASQKMYKELVEVEMKSGAINWFCEDDDDDAGFGIWIHDKSKWVYHAILSNSILTDGQGNARDIDILDIVYQLETYFKHKNIIVIFPNCSPVTGPSLTDEEERALKTSVKVFNPKGETRRIKQFTPLSQFLYGLDFLARVHYNFVGMKNKYSMVLSSPVRKSSSASAVSASAAEATTSYQEDTIGIVDQDDIKNIFVQFGYFFKDYYHWHNPELNEMLNDKLLQTGILTEIPTNFNTGKFLLMLMILIFSVREKYGGIMYEDDKRLMKKVKDDSDSDSDDALSGKGRSYLLQKIMEKAENGANGRRGESRTDEEIDIAQSQIYEIIEKANAKAHEMDSGSGRIRLKPYENYDELVSYSIAFASGLAGGKKRKKRKTRKRKRKTKRNSPSKKRRTRSKSSKRRRKKTRRNKGRQSTPYSDILYERQRKEHKKKHCGKYYKGAHGIHKKACKKDSECIYSDHGSGGEWCFTKKRGYIKRKTRRKK